MVAEIVECGVDDEKRWDEFVESRDEATVYHLSGWRRVIERSFGHRTHYLMAQDEAGRIRGILPLVQLDSRMFGNFLVSMPFFNYGGVLADGPVATDELLQAAADHASDLACSHVELRESEARQKDLPVRLDKVAMRRQLPETADLLWQELGSKVRAQIRKADRAGLKLRTGGADLLDDFYEVFAEKMRDLGTPVYSKAFFEQVLSAPPSVSSMVVVGYLGNKPVAGAVLLGYRGTLEVPWASTLRAGNSVCANMGLYWRLLELGCEAGYQTFDFGRSTRDGPTYRFKKQWGATPVQLRWHYWLPEGKQTPQLSPDNPRYRLAVQAWQKLPVWVTRLVGPHIVRNLP